MARTLTAIVLAAGMGKRMKSSLPKVLHRVAGRPLAAYPIRAALEVGATEIVLVASPEIEAEMATTLARSLPETKLRIAVQPVARGTADAAKVGIAGVTSELVLILCGDTPLVRAADLARLLEAFDRANVELALLTAELDDPQGYGRVLRGDDGRLEVREQKDLRDERERRVREVNAGMYVARTEALRAALAKIEPNNAQGEFYLTDAVALCSAAGGALAVVGHPDNLLGVNDRAQLAAAETLKFQQIAARHQLAGVSVKTGARIDDAVEIEPDATIEGGVVLRGRTRVASGAVIDVGCVVTDAEVGQNAFVKPYSVLSESRVGAGAQIGPFAHLRPGSEIDDDAHIGNFVETKKTRVRKGAKANHLAYLGDGDVGEGANVGAGTIFCNYDGYKKHKTVIGKNAFIGSDSQLVAPVTVGEGAYVATGTTVTKDVPNDALAIARVRQENKDGYASRLRARLGAGSKKG